MVALSYKKMMIAASIRSDFKQFNRQVVEE
jgi:hypothetical protein